LARGHSSGGYDVKKVAINANYSGFCLSRLANEKLVEWGFPIPKGKKWPLSRRQEPLLIKVIEELGEKANGPYSRLKIVEVPDNIGYTIEQDGGKEWVWKGLLAV